MKLQIAILSSMCWVGAAHAQSASGGSIGGSTGGLISSDQFQNQIAVESAWWSQLGGSSLRNGNSPTNQTSGSILLDPDWISDGDGDLQLSFTPHASAVCDDERVYVLGLDQEFTHRLSSFDLNDGSMVWSSEIPFKLLDSWSSPSIDPHNNTIVVAAGFTLLAIDCLSGEQVWSIDLGMPLVNASPCVTDDLDCSDRVFLTDYSFSSGSLGMLYCVNVDPFDAVLNPYQPGELVWAAGLPGECSGNTPAYHDGVVYVSTADNGSGGAGHVLAFDARALMTPEPLWDTQNPQPIGFFSGVSVADGAVYASSYNFSGGQRSANTIKLRASDGQVQWSAPTVRTDAAPVILGDGRIVVSGGVPTSPSTFFSGSLPAIELIEDLGDSAVVLWDSFEATHEDLNTNGQWDQGEPYLSLGGWGHQPLVYRDRGSPKLLVGSMLPPTFNDPLTHAGSLHTIDLSKHPTESGFVISTQKDAGTTPALFGNRVLTTSSSGIASLHLSRAPITGSLIQQIRDVVDGHAPIESLRGNR
ncbi:MAG: PQQ-like beta-propeller repeat protein [Phycisphaerales bacterium]|nr:PQQ-like beta-propeller repeat protein [Phycisphaerales bacterium]